jgi:hypothetical protein
MANEDSRLGAGREQVTNVRRDSERTEEGVFATVVAERSDR